MPESFEMFRYVDHLRHRWRMIAVACGVAAVLAFVAALLTPSQYTATTRLIIEPPAGSDLRAAMAISPIYLESLKSYELLSSGDRLFLDAIEHFKLPRSKPVDALKRSVLKVTIPRNTKILEISATLPDPAKAQALALYIAEQAVRLSRDVSIETEGDLVSDAQKQWSEARTRLEQAEIAWARAAESPVTQAPDRAAQIDTAQAQRDAARLAFEAAEKRVQEIRAMTGMRGERLKIIDPGTVPERPSWPNIPLIVLAALVVALAGTLLYMTIEFNHSLEKPPAPRALPPLARVKTRND